MTQKKSALISEQNRKEILYNVINSLLAGALVFLGSLTNGFSWAGVCAGLVASAVVAVTKFKEYWESEAQDYCSPKVFNFI